jgi:hypothetical protein
VGDKMFEWKKGNAYTAIVTLSANYLTLNAVAAGYFASVRYCMLGFDKRNQKLAIKPVSKEEIELRVVSLDNLYRISQGNGYSRISCKALLLELKDDCVVSLDNNKCAANYDEAENLLVVDLQRQGG